MKPSSLRYRTILIFIGLILFLVSVHTTHAATYYVDSATGLDSNNGTSSSTPWQTITKVDTSTFHAGDQVLFQGGETFVGSLQFTASSSGTSISPITIASYGSGRATINSATSTG